MSRLVDAVAPPRLGSAFRVLLASSWTTNLGDGIVLAAGPLLVASRTDHAFLVALAALLQWLPPMLFGLWAGALADRLDRRVIMVVVNLCRVGVLVLLAGAVAFDLAPIALVLVAMFLIGTAEAFSDTTSNTLLPMLVARPDIAIANSRLQAGYVTVNQLVGPPIGAVLFTVGHFVPFAAHGLVVLFAVVMLTRLELPRHARPGDAARPVWHDIVAGLRWTVQHAAVRTLVLAILMFNITFGAAWSVMVLYTTEHLGLGSIGFGLITSVSALGGLFGTLCYGGLIRRFRLGDLLRYGLVIETFTHLAMAVNSSPYLALPIFFIFGAHAFVWNTTSITVRQRAVPTKLQGRVGAVYTLGVYAGLVVGAALGGLLAQHGGLTAPFWFGFLGSAIFVVLIWRQMGHVTDQDQHHDQTDEADEPDELLVAREA